MSNDLILNKMKRLYILMMLLLTSVMVEAQTSVWDGSRKLWTRGEGTENNPYLIESAENLAFLAYMVNKGFETQGLYFRLTTDIDLNGSEDQPWIPIGLYDKGFDEDGCDRGFLNSVGFSPKTAFRGHFDGGNHVISNIYLDNAISISPFSGLFGRADASWSEEEIAVIENVFVSNGHIKGMTCGGIVGYGGRLVVSNCRNGADIEGDNVGGVVGAGGAVKVNNCSNAGLLTGSNVGGIVGARQSKVEIVECFNEGNITASQCGGGILCGSNKASIDNSYNAGDVSVLGDTSTYFPAAGGLVGIASPNFEAKNSYNVGNISGNHHVGCLIGYAGLPENISVENCYYLDVCSSSDFGIPKSAEEMRDNAFVDILNQNDHVWGSDVNNVNDGFPILTQTNLSINNYAEKNLSIYPNPANRIVSIEGICVAEIQIYNVLGHRVRTFTNTNRISVEGLSEGVYLLRIFDQGGNSYLEKIVKE